MIKKAEQFSGVSFGSKLTQVLRLFVVCS